MSFDLVLLVLHLKLLMLGEKMNYLTLSHLSRNIADLLKFIKIVIHIEWGGVHSLN